MALNKADKSRLRTIALARLMAREEVKAEIRRRGDKVSHYSARAITELADDWLKSHRSEIEHEIVMRRWLRYLEPERQVPQPKPRRSLISVLFGKGEPVIELGIWG